MTSSSAPGIERNASRTGRRWYPFSAANNDLTPYDVPRNPAFTQYDVSLRTDDLQCAPAGSWHITDTLTLQAGFKSMFQTAGNNVITNQRNAPAAAVPVVFPTGTISSNGWFLPQVGATWEADENWQVFANIQENYRQTIPYAAGSNFYGSSPFSLGTQSAFDTVQDARCIRNAPGPMSWACAPITTWTWGPSPASKARPTIITSTSTTGCSTWRRSTCSTRRRPSWSMSAA